MTLILGVDSNWGNVKVTRMTLTSADGGRISATLYKPKIVTMNRQIDMMQSEWIGQPTGWIKDK
jgi:hypothetical protein